NCLHGCAMHATGCGEPWVGWDTTAELYQVGCTCTSNNHDYSAKTIMGNWNKELYDTQRTVQPKALPSRYYTHCFETTYSSDYSMGKHQRIKSTCTEQKHSSLTYWFPGHHPEMEPPSFNPAAQSCHTIDSVWQHFLCLCPTLREGTQRMQE
ncbi:CK001 protein, partial [Glaucidium brasilianum]|nr:CK001 protein [Glaucidium brasilianum]